MISLISFKWSTVSHMLECHENPEWHSYPLYSNCHTKHSLDKYYYYVQESDGKPEAAETDKRILFTMSSRHETEHLHPTLASPPNTNHQTNTDVCSLGYGDRTTAIVLISQQYLSINRFQHYECHSR